LSGSWRPDRIGIVVTEAGNVTVGQWFLPVVLFHVDVVDASQGEAGLGLLRHFISRGFAVMVIHGSEARIEFDRSRWPGISTDEIEAALRYELSQDADELKRLGAVGEEFRPLSRNEAAAACREERAGKATREEET